MTNIIASPLEYYKIEDGFQHYIRDTTKFYKETFSFPKKLELPDDHFEVTAFGVFGDIQSGKTHTIKYLATICKGIWGDNIDFFECDDIFSTIQAVKQSNKFAHFVFIDDIIRPEFDSRRSMGRLNVSASQKYMIIRHLIKEGYLDYGYLIIGIASQMYSAVDKRIKKHLSFSLFKTYDEECEDAINDYELIDFLKLLKDKSSRVKDWRYRRFGIAVASDGLFTPIIVPKTFEQIEFIKVEVDALVKQQLNECVNFLTVHDLEYLKNDDLKGMLYLFLDKLTKEYRFCEVTSQMFTEIIYRARIISKIEKYSDEEDIDNYLELVGEYVKQKCKEAEINNKTPSITERIEFNLRWNLILHLDQLSLLCGTEYGVINAVINNNKNKFEKVSRGFVCLKENTQYVTKDEIKKCKKLLGMYKEPMKKLKAPELTN